MRLLILCLALAIPSSQARADFTGRVVTINDGDTLIVLIGTKQAKVRLDAIDAPEHKQPFGAKSKQSLADLCAGKEAFVEERGQDRYGRTIGRVKCAGLEVNAEQVRRGMAWVYVKYANKDSPLFELELQARTSKLGLWSDPQPIAPWLWRKLNRRGR